MKLNLRSIPAAAAMTALLVMGVQAQAQTTASPPTNAKGDAAPVPKGPDATPKSAEQRDMKKPMAKEGDKAGVMGKGGAANMPASPATTASRDKAMGSSSSVTGKSGQPAGSTATGGAGVVPKGPNTSTKDSAGTGMGTGTTK